MLNTFPHKLFTPALFCLCSLPGEGVTVPHHAAGRAPARLPFGAPLVQEKQQSKALLLSLPARPDSTAQGQFTPALGPSVSVTALLSRQATGPAGTWR